jgi:3-phenylpropionate/trans-cinnamate dioxygenase ferredoxin reductase subunit
MMGKICKVTLNKETFYANCGDLLLDSAITNGVEIPHDCRSGICGSCKVRVVDGKLFGGTEGDMAHACQARVVSDLKIVTEPVPDTVTMSAEVGDLARLAPDVIGVTLDVQKPLRFFPGQYIKVQFRGFPVRCYSPTYPMAGAPDNRLLYLHIRKLKNGIVSSALGRDITAGHRVKVIGPLGTAFFRPKHRGRIVLVASGTGFAPMWSIAVAAITENPKREMVFIVTARTLQSFYMHQALCRLARFPNVKIIPIVSEPQNVSPAIRSGRPTEHMPDLTPDDVVYTCGAPAMTDAVAKMARAAGARCHCDPFVSSAQPSEQGGNLMGRLTGWLDSQRGRPAMLPAEARV